MGASAGAGAENSNNSNFFGANAGFTATNAPYSNFIGADSGNGAYSASYSSFIGYGAGSNSYNASGSIFIGSSAGSGATSAASAVFIGDHAGELSGKAKYSVLIGYGAGYRSTGFGICNNNIIIGTQITLPNNRKDSINIGGVIFATGSYAGTDDYTSPFSGSMTTAKVGINKSLPQYTLDVSGSVGIATVLHLAESDPLPAGTIGDLAVSASHLWFYNGSWSQLD